MRSPARIGPVTLGTIPRVVATLTDGADRSRARAARERGADLLELRIDCFDRLDPTVVARQVRALRRVGLPLIATIRWKAEGGRRVLAEPARLALFNTILPLVEAVDIEFRAVIFRSVVRTATRAGKAVIVSYHNLRKTPDEAVLDRVIRQAARYGIVKIATLVRGQADVFTLATLLIRHQRLVVIGLGQAGAISRVVFPLLGSLLTYGHVGTPAAPGQSLLTEVVTGLRRHDSAYNRAFVERIRRRRASGRAGLRSYP